MIIELGRYNKIKELLIEIGITGSQGHICNRDGDLRISVARAAVCMEEQGTGRRTGCRGTYNWPPSWE